MREIFVSTQRPWGQQRNLHYRWWWGW